MGLQKHLSHKFTMSAALPIGRNIRSLSQQSHLSRKVKKNNLSARGAGVSTSSTRGLSWPVWYHGVVQNHLVYHFSASKLCSFGMCMAILRYFTISPANPFKIWAPATVCMAGNSPYPTDPILEFVALLTRRFLGVPRSTGVPGEFQRIYAQEKRRKPLSRSSMHFVIFFHRSGPLRLWNQNGNFGRSDFFVRS